MAIGPTIETERLLLRPPRAEDIPAWNAFHADEDVMRHLGGVQGLETKRLAGYGDRLGTRAVVLGQGIRDRRRDGGNGLCGGYSGLE